MKLRSHLIFLVVATLLPLLIFAGIMIAVFAVHQQRQMGTTLVDTARDLSSDVDQELLAWSNILETLATSAYLDSGELKNFYQQALRVAGVRKDLQTIVLADPKRKQLLNIQRPFGSTLPYIRPSDQFQRVIETQRPTVSNLFVGQVLGKPLIGMAVPVIRAGKVRYVLMSAAPPTFLMRLFTKQKIPLDWLGTIIDRNKIIIARTRGFEQFLGKPATPLFAAKSSEAEEVSWRGVTLDGEPVQVATHRSEVSGWTVGVAIPASSVDAPVRRSLMIVAGGGLVFLLAGTLLAILFGRRISNSIASLSYSAAVLGRGETPKAVASPIAEVNEVARALEKAAFTRNQAEESVRETHGQMTGIIESAMDGIVSVDSDQRIILFNSAAERMFQRPAEEVLGKSLDCLIPEDSRAPHREHIRLFGQAGVTKRRIGALGVVTGLRANGEVFPMEASISQTEAGGRKIFTAILRDITERKHAEEQIQRNLERIRALREIDMAITSTLDLRAVLDILLDKIDLVLPYAAATVRLFNRESGLLEPVACRNLDEKEWKAEAWKGGRGTSNIVFESQAPLMIANVQVDARMRDPEFFRKHGLVSYLGVPLVAKGEVLGSLGFYTKEEHRFDSNEVEFLQTLASQAAIAINNAQLYEHVESSRKELELTNQYLERSLRQLSGLYTALTPLGFSESAHEMMDGIIERLMEATGADAALIRLWDKTSKVLARASQRGFPDYYLKAVEVAPLDGAVDCVFKNGEPILAPDIASEPRFQGKIQLQVGLRSAAMLPLKVHNEIRGIIHLSSRTLGYFDEEQRDHLMAIARQMGIALENRELFDSLQESRDELEKANKIKDEFLSVMSHELRTPLNVVVGYSGMIRDGLLGEVNSQQAEALGKVIRRTNDQLALVNNILYATVLEAETVAVETQDFNLEDFLNQLKLGYEAPINKDLTFDWDYPFGLPNITTDSGKLKHILQNLIDNAIKFTGKGSVTISARITEGDRQQAVGNRKGGVVEFKVSDTGVGIPKEYLPFVFDKFRQVDSSETRLYGGVGMGLYIVKKFTELLGGTVEVESEVGKGSTFTVRIPC